MHLAQYGCLPCMCHLEHSSTPPRHAALAPTCVSAVFSPRYVAGLCCWQGRGCSWFRPASQHTLCWHQLQSHTGCPGNTKEKKGLSPTEGPIYTCTCSVYRWEVQRQVSRVNPLTPFRPSFWRGISNDPKTTQNVRSLLKTCSVFFQVKIRNGC